ncbi:DUF4914 family protein, partial [Halanaerobium saccharolyticum]|uniref:DUF4914 family protein n=1 Tax=Halanaerobium saccharolyticum TaxID=43595 RepID=UPI00058F432E
RQPEVGQKAYDIGGKILSDFFKKCIKEYLEPGLNPIGKKIIETALNDGSVEAYSDLIKYFIPLFLIICGKAQE